MKNVILAALAGLLYALAFPAYSLWPLACLFGLPLFLAVKDATWREAFLYGLMAGIVAWGGLIYWVAYVVNIYGYLNLGVSALILLGFMVYLAVYMGIFAALAAGLLASRFAVLSVPGIWVLLELFRSYALTGFPWALLGYALYPVKPLIQVAEFGGVYLISGLAMMVNLAVYRLVRRDFKPLVVALCALAVDFYALDADIFLQQGRGQQRQRFGHKPVQPLSRVVFTNGKLLHKKSPFCRSDPILPVLEKKSKYL